LTEACRLYLKVGHWDPPEFGQTLVYRQVMGLKLNL